jgi:hypothetical protein
LCRAVDRNGDLADIMLSEHRDMTAAKAFFRSAKSATGLVPDKVTTDRHGSYRWAIRSALGKRVAHRTNACRNNGLEQDHRGIRAGSDVCVGSRATPPLTGSVAATLNSATTSALAAATISMFPPTAVAWFLSVAQQPRSPFSPQRRPTPSARLRWQLWREF